MGRVAPLIRALMLGSLSVSTLPSGARPASAEGFGRWETPLQQCRMSTQDQPKRPCLRLRLEQNLEGLLSMRFLGDGQAGSLASEELTFAGVLAKGHPPMACRQDGRCLEPSQPLQLLVGSVAWARFNSRGLVDSLPQARLARGQCRLEHGLIRCEAKEDRRLGTANWSAEGRFGD